MCRKFEVSLNGDTRFCGVGRYTEKSARNIQRGSQESLKNIKTCMNKVKLYKVGQRTARRL